MSASRHSNLSQYPSRGSRTHTITTNDPSTSSSTHAVPSSSAAPVPERHTPAILRLRGAPPATSRSVQWAENVVDNEHLNRKKSKSMLLSCTVCCIYHRPRGVDESSSESSSSSSSESSSSESDSDSDLNDADRPRGRNHRAHKHTNHCNHRGGTGNGNKKGKGKAPRKPSPNAYERQPKPHNLKGPPRKS